MQAGYFVYCKGPLHKIQTTYLFCLGIFISIDKLSKEGLSVCLRNNLKNNPGVLKYVLTIMFCVVFSFRGYTQNGNAKDIDRSDVEAVFITKFKFDNYKVPVFSGRKAKFNSNISHTARLYRTALREEYKLQEVNFGGHYILVTWGCGAPCLGGALVDVKNGKVYDVPYSYIGYDFRKNSRLLITNPPYITSSADIHLAYLVNRGTDIPEIYVFNEATKKFNLKYRYKYGE